MEAFSRHPHNIIHPITGLSNKKGKKQIEFIRKFLGKNYTSGVKNDKTIKYIPFRDLQLFLLLLPS